MSGGSRSSALGGGDPLLPSPASPAAVIVSPETLSHHSSPSKSAKPTAHVQIASPPKYAEWLNISVWVGSYFRVKNVIRGRKFNGVEYLVKAIKIKDILSFIKVLLS